MAMELVYGVVSEPMPKTRIVRGDPHTHSWRLFVDVEGTDAPEEYIREVEFTLHPDYKPAKRKVTEPPFEVRETGWGAWEAGIKVFLMAGGVKESVKLIDIRPQYFQDVSRTPIPSKMAPENSGDFDSLMDYVKDAKGKDLPREDVMVKRALKWIVNQFGVPIEEDVAHRLLPSCVDIVYGPKERTPVFLRDLQEALSSTSEANRNKVAKLIVDGKAYTVADGEFRFDLEKQPLHVLKELASLVELDES
eukprot:Clim_evm11s223 gene=Clim_evmTU11s223